MNRIALILLALTLSILITFLVYFFSSYEPITQRVKIAKHVDEKSKVQREIYEDETSELDTQDKKENIVADNTFTLYVVLDDAGLNLEEVLRFKEFPGALTFAIIPDLVHSKDVERYLNSEKIPYLLHLPMEPIGNEDPGPRALLTRMSDDELNNMIHFNLSYFKNYVGINNHMGSKATSDVRVVDTLLSLIPKDKIILDSRTHKESILESEAQQKEFTALHRDVFIDNFDDKLYIIEQIRKGVEIAQKRGYAILIGHVSRINILSALLDVYEEVLGSGGTFQGLEEFL